MFINYYIAYQREKVMKWSESYCIAWNKFKQEIPSLSPRKYYSYIIKIYSVIFRGP